MTWFSYNSHHKTIAALFIIVWAIVHYVLRNKPDNVFPNGQIKYTGTIVNGKNEGTWVWYYENGKQQIKGNFINGKREGIWTTWNNKGIQIKTCEYHHDKLNGSCTEWDSNGKIISRQLFHEDAALQ